MANLIDFGIELGEMEVVVRYGVAILIFAALQMAAGITTAWKSSKAAAGFSSNLRNDMYQNVQTFAFSNIDKFSTASIVTRLTTDVTNVQNAYMMILRMAIRAPFMLIFSMIACFNINIPISLTYLVILPVLGLGLFLVIRKVHPIFQKVFRTYDTLNNVVQEDLRGIRVVKSFNQEEHEISKFQKISEKIYRNFAKGERLLALNSPMMQFCMYTSMILIAWLGAQAIVASDNNIALGLTTGQLTALISYSAQILGSLMALSMIFAMVVIAQSSAERIAEVLQEKSDIVNPENPLMQVPDGRICFRDVSFVYASKADKPVVF